MCFDIKGWGFIDAFRCKMDGRENVVCLEVFSVRSVLEESQVTLLRKEDGDCFGCCLEERTYYEMMIMIVLPLIK